MYSSTEEGDLEKEVAGEYNTFRVYVYMLKAKSGSMREVQRALDFSSPALATHHLKKLEKLGLVTKDHHGTYHVVPKSFGILRFFVVWRRWIVPRSVFVVFVFAVMTVGFLVFLPQRGYLVWALVVSVVGLILSVFEAVRFYRLLPKAG